jgi:ACS family glucarate transporter-like MFS transporter
MPYTPPQAPYPLTADEGAASRVRYRVVGMLVLMAVLLYLDRFCIGVAAPAIMEELQISKEEFGRTYFGFFFAYALLQVPAGRLSDRLGTRYTLSAYVALWSLATLALGFAYGLVSILLVRVLLGVFQAGAYPSAAAAIRNWMPLAGRARASGFVSGGGRLGNVLGFAVTPLLMSAVAVSLGWSSGLWRPVFAVYCLLGLIWAAVFYWRHRDRPRLNPACDAAEIALIESNAQAAAELPTQRLSLKPLLLDYNVWVLSSINVLLNVGWVFLVTWMPTYLVEEYGSQLNEVFASSTTDTNLDTVVAGLLTAATGLAGLAGNVFGGWLGDRAVGRYGLRWGRRAAGLTSSVLAALIYLAAQWTDNLWLFVAEMIAISFLSDLVLGSLWATYQDIGGGNTAVVLGFANMCGNLGAAGYGWLIGLLADQRQWSVVFAISSIGFAIAAVSWFIADATRVVKTR